MPVIILVADGARPDTLGAALDSGALPALARLRAEGGLHTVASTFPSVTGPAYAPFVMGRFPGPIGLPALRWYDRARTRRTFPDHTRSYVGAEMRHVDGDLDANAPTMFELVPGALGALSVIRRGLPKSRQVGMSARWAVRAAHTHFRGDVHGWLDIDRDVAREVAQRIRELRPAFVFAALTGVDKTSHSEGHGATVVSEGLVIVDDAAAEIRRDAEAAGTWDDTHLWIVSDHGHSEVHSHDDLADLLRARGTRTIAHPFTLRLPGRRAEAAMMVSGNAMAQVYLELERRERPWWPALASRWEPLAAELLARDSVDVMLLPHDRWRCEVRAAGDRGAAMVHWRETSEGGRYDYRRTTGDPLGVGRDFRGLDARDAFDAVAHTDYPDAVVQIARLAGAERSGEMILSAARGWDFRLRYEPIPHVSSHGALHREHMDVPLLLSRPAAVRPRRTVDVTPSALAALRLPIPAGLDGTSFL